LCGGQFGPLASLIGAVVGSVVGGINGYLVGHWASHRFVEWVKPEAAPLDDRTRFSRFQIPVGPSFSTAPRAWTADEQLLVSGLVDVLGLDNALVSFKPHLRRRYFQLALAVHPDQHRHDKDRSVDYTLEVTCLCAAFNCFCQFRRLQDPDFPGAIDGK
jgi:hypothetical protein